MNVTALIVEWQTPDLLDLCLTSLRTFAPSVYPEIVTGGPGAHYHAERIIEYQRQWRFRGGNPDVVVLLDTDVVITSPGWLDAMTRPLANGHVATGGLRSRGDASQMFIDGHPILHASCLAVRFDFFREVIDFHSKHDQITNFTQLDTAHQISLEAAQKGLKVHAYPFRRVGHGKMFPQIEVGEYFDMRGDGRTLWAHCWRGTNARSRGPAHRLVRKVKAALGNPHAITLNRAEERRREFLRRGWSVVKGAL